MAADLGFKQDELKFIYDSAHTRMGVHPEHTKNQKEILEKYNFLKTEDEALEKAKSFIKDGSFMCQVWANIEKDEEYYYYADKWIVTDDFDILTAAEFLGFAQVYTNSELHKKFAKDK